LTVFSLDNADTWILSDSFTSTPALETLYRCGTGCNKGTTIAVQTTTKLFGDKLALTGNYLFNLLTFLTALCNDIFFQNLTDFYIKNTIIFCSFLTLLAAVNSYGSNKVSIEGKHFENTIVFFPGPATV
jgi:hypothetical protein